MPVGEESDEEYPPTVAQETLFRRRVRGLVALERLGQSEGDVIERKPRLHGQTVEFQAGPTLPVTTENTVSQICINLETGQLMLMKEFRRAGKERKADFRARCAILLHEFQALRVDAQRPPDETDEFSCIVRPLGVQESSSLLRLSTEYIAGGTLRGLLSKFGALNVRTCQVYTNRLTRAISALHSVNIVHGAISARSFLLCANGLVKLHCIGSTKHMQSMERGFPADIWGLGLTVLEMLIGKEVKSSCPDETIQWIEETSDDPRPQPVSTDGVGLQFSQQQKHSIDLTDVTMDHTYQSDEEVPSHVAKFLEAAKLTSVPRTLTDAVALVFSSLPAITIPESLPASARDFIQKCLIPDRYLRPTAQDLLKHPFITELVADDDEPDLELLDQPPLSAYAGIESASRESSTGSQVLPTGFGYEALLKTRGISTFGMTRGMSDGTAVSRNSDIDDLPMFSRLAQDPYRLRKPGLEADDTPLVMPDGWGLFDPKMDANKAVGNPDVKARFEAARSKKLDDQGRTMQQRMFLERWGTRAAPNDPPPATETPTPPLVVAPEPPALTPINETPGPESRDTDGKVSGTPGRKKWWNNFLPSSTTTPVETPAARTRSTSVSEMLLRRFSPGHGKTPAVTGAGATPDTPDGEKQTPR